MLKQNEVIQIKLSSTLKKLLTKISEERGMPVSTFIKSIIYEYLKKDNLWNEFQSKELQSSIIEKFIKELK